MDNIQKQLRDEDICKVIERYSKCNLAELISYKIHPFSKTIEGFLAHHFKVEITYKDESGTKSMNCFMKTVNGVNDIIFQIELALNAYEKEEFFYMILLDKFKEYGIDTSFSPDGYFCKPRLVILEDLRDSHYNLICRDDFLKFEYLTAALETIAKFHSSCIIFENFKSRTLGRVYTVWEEYGDILRQRMITRDNSAITIWFKTTLEAVFQSIDLIKGPSNANLELKSKVEEIFEAFINLSEEKSSYTNTLLHSDLWVNNFLFRYKKGLPLTSVLIDYQTLTYGPPALDVMHLLSCNLSRSFRKENFGKLIDTYYDYLTKILGNFGINSQEILPKSELLRICDKIKPIVTVLALIDRTVTSMPNDLLLEVAKSEEDFSAFMLTNRTKYITKAYTTNSVYRELFDEDISELRFMLLDSVEK